MVLIIDLARLSAQWKKKKKFLFSSSSFTIYDNRHHALKRIFFHFFIVIIKTFYFVNVCILNNNSSLWHQLNMFSLFRIIFVTRSQQCVLLLCIYEMWYILVIQITVSVYACFISMFSYFKNFGVMRILWHIKTVVCLLIFYGFV